MSKLGFIFPGQGSQYSGMGRLLWERFPEARQVFEAADRSLGLSISRLCFEGAEEDLRLTENTQPAILTVSVAAYRVLEAAGLRPQLVAGHSLGEYSAAVAAGAVSLEEAVVTVRRRGRYMQEAVPVGTGAMAAVLGMGADELAQVCAEAADGHVVAPANFNSPGQIVIAGHAEAVERASILARTRGARRAIPLPVSAPFHCALMMPAQERLAADLAAMRFAAIECGLVNNVDAAVVRDPEAIRDGLWRQVSRPVRWQESMEKMLASGIDAFVEVGPGKVLAGLVRKLPGEHRVYNVEDPAGLDFLLGELRQRPE